MATDKLINQSQGDDIISALDDIATGVGNITYGEQTSSDKVVAMTGYQKESTAAAISPGDSLNVAIGKLEKKVDDNTANKVAGPSSTVVDENIVLFDGSDGKTVKSSGVAIVTTMDDESDAEVPTSEAIGEYITDQKFAVGLDSSTANHLVKFKDNNGKNLEDTGISVETSSASALSNDDVHIPTSKLVKTEVDKKVTSIKAPVSGSSTKVDKNNEVAFQQASGQSPAVTVTGDATNGTVTIEHQTGAGYNHIPTSGTTGQYLRNSGTAGNASWTSPLTTWPATPEHTDVLPSTKLLDDRFDTDEANILYNLNMGVKNKLPCKISNNNNPNDTGVKCNYNEDGTYTVIGTKSTSDSYLDIDNIYADKLNGDHMAYISVTGTGTCQIAAYGWNGTGYTLMLSTSSQQSFNIGNYTHILFRIRFMGEVGTSYNATVKVMVCTIDAWNQSHDWQPPALPNYDLTRLEAQDRAALAEVVDSGAKNKLQYDLTSLKAKNTDGTWNNNAYTIGGITYTLNSDMSISISGTRSSEGNAILNLAYYTAVSGDLMSQGTIGVQNVFFYARGGSSSCNTIGYTNIESVDIGVNRTYALAVTAVAGTAVNQRYYPMICTKAAFGVSQKFVPYRLPYDDVQSKTTLLMNNMGGLTFHGSDLNTLVAGGRYLVNNATDNPVSNAPYNSWQTVEVFQSDYSTYPKVYYQIATDVTGATVTSKWRRRVYNSGGQYNAWTAWSS